jgi:NADH:ubiquinone oxidoreductase subunit 2 (subunit N)
MFETPSLADLNLGVTLPAISLALGATILLLLDILFVPRDRKEVTGYLALAGVVVSFVLNLFTFNQSGDASMVVPSEYLEVVINRK